MALEDNNYNHLEELGDSNFEIIDGEPNIKGWDVKNTAGDYIGEVDELLFDPQSRNVRYLIVDLSENKLAASPDRKVLVPIGIAKLYDGKLIQESDDVQPANNEEYAFIATEPLTDPAAVHAFGNPSNIQDTPVAANAADGYSPLNDAEVVILPVTLEQLNALPAYEKDKLTTAQELSIRQVFDQSGTSALAADTNTYDREGFYAHEHFNEDKFYDRRTVPLADQMMVDGDQNPGTTGVWITDRIIDVPTDEATLQQEEDRKLREDNSIDGFPNQTSERN